jgi:uncharacterized protein (DUF1499 family)
MKKACLGGLMTVLILAGASGAGEEGGGVTGGELSPCPDSPNCVSTQGKTGRHAMEPLPYLETAAKSRERILSILKSLPRTKIVEQTGSYLHVEFRTALWRFVDDVEFLFDDSASVVHFRSASRSGYYDFGVNRRRMKQISETYLASGP